MTAIKCRACGERARWLVIHADGRARTAYCDAHKGESSRLTAVVSIKRLR